MEIERLKVERDVYKDAKLAKHRLTVVCILLYVCYLTCTKGMHLRTPMSTWDQMQHPWEL